MNLNDFLVMKKILAPWGLGLIQDARNLFRRMDREGISIDELEEFISEYPKRMTEIFVIEEAQRSEKVDLKNVRIKPLECPECGTRLMLNIISIPKGPNNLYGHKTYVFCPNESCLYEFYSGKNIKELFIERTGT